MLGTFEVESFLACPVCGNDLNGNLQCRFCNRKFSRREGVFVMIDRETSGVEWRWDRRILSQKYRQDVIKGYRRLISSEVRQAQSRWWDQALPKVEGLSGVTVDLATGLGMMLEQVLERTDSQVIATDIDPNVMLSTKREFDRRILRKATYIATDLKHLSLKENIADNVTSFNGLNNIVDPGVAVSEVYRILRPGGRAVVMASFVNPETRSADLAEDYGFLEAYLEDRFIEMVERAGFEIVENRQASSVIWRENEMDIFPIDGDMVHYHVIELGK